MYGQAPLKDDEYVLERRITAFKWTMMVHHVLSFILALVTFCLCVWIRFDLDFWEWVVEIDWYSYWYAMYVIMITMVIMNILVALLLGIAYVQAGGHQHAECYTQSGQNGNKFRCVLHSSTL